VPVGQRVAGTGVAAPAIIWRGPNSAIVASSVSTTWRMSGRRSCSGAQQASMREATCSGSPGGNAARSGRPPVRT